MQFDSNSVSRVESVGVTLVHSREAQSVLAGLLGAHEEYVSRAANLSGLATVVDNAKPMINPGGDLVRIIDIESEKAAYRSAVSLNCTGRFVGEELGECQLPGTGASRTFFTDGLDGTLAYRFHSLLLTIQSGDIEQHPRLGLLQETLADLNRYLLSINRMTAPLSFESLSADPALVSHLLKKFDGFGHLLAVYDGEDPLYADALVAGFAAHARRCLYLAVKGCGTFKLDLSSPAERKIAEEGDIEALLRSGQRVVVSENHNLTINADILSPAFARYFPPYPFNNSVAVAGMFMDVVLKGEPYMEITREPLKRDLEPAVLFLLLKEAGAEIFDIKTGLSIERENIGRRGQDSVSGLCAATGIRQFDRVIKVLHQCEKESE